MMINEYKGGKDIAGGCGCEMRYHPGSDLEEQMRTFSSVRIHVLMAEFIP